MKRKKNKRVLSFILVFLMAFINSTYLPKAAEVQIINFVYPEFTDLATNNLLNLIGNASFDGYDLMLTPSEYNQAGAAFFNQKLSLANDKSFSTYFEFTISDSKVSQPGYAQGNSGLGADGLVFVINNYQNSLGGLGNGIGYAGIYNSLGIEFDTYINNEAFINDPMGDHLGINLNGSPQSVATVVNPAGVALESGNPVHAWVDYNGAIGVVEVRINSTNTRPTNPTLSYNVDLSTVLNSTDVYVGFTSGTGGAASRHAIKSWFFDSKYNPIDVQNRPYSFASTSITGTANPSVNTNSTTATFTVRDIYGIPDANIPVYFSTNIGNLSTPYAVTDANGQVSVQLSGGTTSGTAVIRAETASGIFTTVYIHGFDGAPPTYQDVVFPFDIVTTSEEQVWFSPTGDFSDTVWLAPEGTTVFTESATMTKTSGTSTTINAPSIQGVYKLYVVDALGNVSSPSNASVTVDNTPPELYGAEDGKGYYTGRFITFSDALGTVASAAYTKDNGSSMALNNGTLLSEAGEYSITVTDSLGNTRNITFEIKALPAVSDVLYTDESKNLIDEIRKELIENTSLTDPYKTEIDNALKALEDRYAELDSETKSIINDTLSISASEDLLAQKDKILEALAKIDSLTKEQQAALADQKELLLNLLNKINAATESSNDSSNESTIDLPKTGSLIDLNLLGTLGSTVLLIGLLLVIKRKKDIQNN